MIKCNHNYIADYINSNFINGKKTIGECIKNNSLSDKEIILEKEINFYENICCYCFKFHNYLFINDNLNCQYVFFYLCMFNYINLVKLYLKCGKFDIKTKVI